MLKIYQALIKTTYILLLFSLVPIDSSAATYTSRNRICDSHIFNLSFLQFAHLLIPEDTLQSNPALNTFTLTQESGFLVPEVWINKSFDFQVNSNISYYKFSHFTQNESKKLFFQAWMKEKELKKITAATDSLRKEYGHSQDYRKDEIASIILNEEKRSIQLNQEIPELYQKARMIEAEYWRTASPEISDAFRTKIRLYLDSIKSSSEVKTESPNSSVLKQDTLILYRQIGKSQEANSAKNTGISYKIQIGAFKNKIPDSAARVIKKLSLIRKIETYQDEKGVKIYTTGDLKTWTEAETLQKQVKQEGARNPSIAAYENNKRIPVNEARKKNNEL